MTTPQNPLASLLTEAQKILIAGSSLMGPSKAATIKALADLLCSPEANVALLHADAYKAKAVAEARSQFIPALEAAQHKLAELREHYTGMQGMSIDRVQVQVGTALQMAREGE